MTVFNTGEEGGIHFLQRRQFRNVQSKGRKNHTPYSYRCYPPNYSFKTLFPHFEHPTSPSLLEISNFWRNTAGRGGTPPWARTIFNLLSIQPVGRRTTFKLPLNSNLQWPRHSPSDGYLNLIFLLCKSPDPN